MIARILDEAKTEMVTATIEIDKKKLPVLKKIATVISVDEKKEGPVTLKDITTLDSKSDKFVILKVKPGKEDELIQLGFMGSEEKLRISRGEELSYTIFRKNGKNVSWNQGTLVSDNLKRLAKMIRDCVEKDYGLKCFGFKG